MGYRNVYIHNHPFFPGKKRVGEHRIVMAESLGRPLLRTELVHHRDENKANNKRRNLKIMNPKKHSCHHNLGSIRSIETKKKMSLNNKGIGNPMFGKPGTMLGKHFSVETKKKMSISHTGKVFTVKHRRNISLARKDHYLELKSARF